MSDRIKLSMKGSGYQMRIRASAIDVYYPGTNQYGGMYGSIVVKRGGSDGDGYHVTESCGRIDDLIKEAETKTKPS